MMFKSRVYCLLMAASVIFLNASLRAQEGTVRQVTKIEFAQRFRQHTNLPVKSTSVSFGGFLPTLKRQLIVSVHYDSEAALGDRTELWSADETGLPGRRLISVSRSRIEGLAVSPLGTALAYVARKPESDEVSKPQDGVDIDHGLYVLDVQSGLKRLITADAVTSIKWTREGNRLLFWKQVGDKQWQPYRASGDLAGELLVEPISPVLSSQPGKFSPDDALTTRSGQFGQPLVEVLATNSIIPVSGDGLPGMPPIENSQIDPKGSGHLQAVQWSPDSRWLYLRVIPTMSMVRVPTSYAFEVATKNLVPLDQSTELQKSLRPNHSLHVGGAAWLPGVKYQLLMWVQVGAPQGQYIPEGANWAVTDSYWLIYDVEADTSKRVTSLPNAFSPHPVISFSPDGKQIVIDSQLYQWDKGL